VVRSEGGMEGRLEKYGLFGTIFQVYPMSPQETCSVTRTDPKVSQRRLCINTVYLCWNIQSNPRTLLAQDDTTCHQEDSTTCSPCLNRRYQIVYLLPLVGTNDKYLSFRNTRLGFLVKDKY